MSSQNGQTILNDLNKASTSKLLLIFFKRCFLQKILCHVNKISLHTGIKNDNIPYINFLAETGKGEPPLHALKIDHIGAHAPYQELYIYYIEGPLNREEVPLRS